MWKARPIFISSTFVDMQGERDYLLTHVFPELEERLGARRHHLEWVDLRVGVATASQPDEDRRELHVLKVCLAEVRRCRPFLIGLLGHRYGWIPPAERMTAAAAEEGFGAPLAGRSVTDLEIDFGVLSDPDQLHHSFFYFREPLPFGDMPPENRRAVLGFMGPRSERSRSGQGAGAAEGADSARAPRTRQAICRRMGASAPVRRRA
jgi:Domain of unknown function (DUF4062)